MLRNNTKVLSPENYWKMFETLEKSATAPVVFEKVKDKYVTILGFISLEDLTRLGYRYKMSL